MTYLPLYTRLVHSEWSASPRKRSAAAAVRENASWRVEVPNRVGNTGRFLNYLRQGPGLTLSGFDFPIGLPESYGEKTGLGDFCRALDTFGSGPCPISTMWPMELMKCRYFGRFTRSAPLQPRAMFTSSRLMVVARLGSFVGDVSRLQYRGARPARCFGPSAATRSARLQSPVGRRSSAPLAALGQSSGLLRAHWKH